MSNRIQVKISVDSQTYESLQGIMQTHGFSSAGALITALVHILLDRTEVADKRKYDLPDDDGRYIDEMFDSLSHVQRTPNGDAPVRRHTKRIK